MGCYYLLVQDGIFHNKEELNSYPHFSTTQVGDFRFVDANGNGILEEDADRVIVGNYMPDLYYGFSVNLSWKGFDMAANFQGVYGNEILNLERRYLLNMEASSNMMKESLQRVAGHVLAHGIAHQVAAFEVQDLVAIDALKIGRHVEALP